METGKRFYRKVTLKPHQKLSIAVVCVTLSVFVLFFFVVKPVADWQEFIAESEALGTYVSGFGFWGPLILALLNLILVVVALLPGHIVVMAAGFLYGLVPGFLLNHFSVLLGSIISFYLARRYGRPVVVRLAPAEMLDRWDTAADDYGFSFFLTCYLLPLFPADVLNFVAGLSTLRFSEFVLANALGRAWITFAITAAGTYSMQIIHLNIPPAAWAAFFGVSFIVYRVWQTHFDLRKTPPVEGKIPADSGFQQGEK